MIKKVILLLTVSVFSLSMVVSSVFAEQVPEDFSWEEVNLLHEQMIEHYENYTEDEIINLELYQKYMNLFTENPNLQEYYIENTLAYNGEAIRNAINAIVIEPNERKVHKFEDGSFLVVETEHYTVQNNKGRSTMFHYADRTVELNKENEYTFTYETGGIVARVTMKLTTMYKVTGRTNIKITDVSVAGTHTNYPRTVSGSSSIITNDARQVRTKGIYTVGGLPPFPTWVGELTQTINIETYISDKNIRVNLSTYWDED